MPISQKPQSTATATKEGDRKHDLEMQRCKAEYEKKLYQSPLTRLHNRHALIENIPKSPYPTLLLVDINDFKRYIDIYGVDVANEMLVMFAKLLETFNENRGYEIYHIEIDTFCLLHHSEFINTQKYEDDLFALLETIKANPLYIQNLDDIFFINVTIGIASGTDNLINDAYNALNKAKATKKQFLFYYPSLDEKQNHKQILQIKKEIRLNIENNNFIPVYQPIVDKTGKVVKYETLIRMRNNGKLVSPAYFLDIAAKTNQYEQISHYILLQALETFKNRDEQLSLNFTQADIRNKTLLRELEHRLKEYKMASRVVFEIVESDKIEDYETTKAFIQRFREYGVKIAIDDFGTGYANFTHIMEIEPEYIKIDGSLIKNLQEDRKSLALVRSITQFAKELDIAVIAEFVTSKEIYEILLALGVDEYQGFYFGKPDIL